MLGQPDSWSHRRFFQLESRAGVYAGEESGYGNRPERFGFHFHPLEFVFVDPELTLHSCEDLRFHIGGLVARLGSRIEHVHVAVAKLLLASQAEIESLSELLHKNVVSLALLFILGDAVLSLFLSLILAFREHL